MITLGLLTPINKIGSDNGSVWLFRCSCGKDVKRKISQVRRSLKRGNNPSCGCGEGTHKQSKTVLYAIYSRMKNRCKNKNNPKYKDYGGRGITICSEWNDFKSFREWAISSGYSNGQSIERKNVNDGYSPDNCEWILFKDQVHNKRCSRRITWNGETLTPRKWSDKYGIPFNALQIRITRKWEVNRIFTQPYRKSICS